MTRPRSGIGTELLAVILIMVCLGGTSLLVVTVHRRAARRPDPAPPSRVVARASVVVPPAPPVNAIPKTHPAPRPALPPPVDPTKAIVARLAAAEADEKREARRADRKAEALELARKDALARSERWRRRELAIRSQVDAMNERAERMEHEAIELASQRDVLARERDAAKAALAKARSSTSYAVMPHKGPNGTWQRPIVIECLNGTARIQPNGPRFSLLELSGLLTGRSSPLVAAVAREVVRAEGLSTPDGAAAVPYIYFIVRPDGIRAYYEARARLEPLGIAFGYELVEQDWEIDFSGLDAGQGESGALSEPVAAARDFTWPAERRGGGGDLDDPDDPFLWPRRSPGDSRGTGDGLGASFSESAGLDRGPVAGGMPGRMPLARDVVPELEDLKNPEGRPGRPEFVEEGLSQLGRGSISRSRAGGLDAVPGLSGSMPGRNPDPSSRSSPGRRGRLATSGSAGNEGPSSALGSGSGSGSGTGSGLTAPGEGEEGNAGTGEGTKGSNVWTPKVGPEIPFEIVVACGPDGVVIHPGGYRLSLRVLRTNRGMLVRQLKTIALLRRQVEPTIRVRPFVRLLVEAGGSETFTEVRRQTILSGLDWPVSLQVADTHTLGVFPKERW